jgi:hypothetical protein
MGLTAKPDTLLCMDELLLLKALLLAQLFYHER